jgi:hypothetical protein
MAEPSADAELGDAGYGSDPGVITYEADEAITAGDAVTIDSTNQLLQAANSGDTNSAIVGIAAEDGTDGDNISVYVSGRVVANVASAVSAGEELAASTTDGQLASGTGGLVALTDAGGVAGLSAGYGLGSNAALVEIR